MVCYCYKDIINSLYLGKNCRKKNLYKYVNNFFFFCIILGYVGVYYRVSIGVFFF